MRIAVIGAGAAGLLSTYLSEGDHDVVLYERDLRVGGHVHSITIAAEDTPVTCELGARFFYDPVYPTLRALLAILGLVPRPRPLSVTFVRRRLGDLAVLPPRTARHIGMLARSPRLLRDVTCYSFLHLRAPAFVARADRGPTLAEHMTRLGLPQSFQQGFLFPLIAAHWGAPLAVAQNLSAYSVLRVLQQEDSMAPVTLDLPGGLGAYIDALFGALRSARVRCGTGVAALRPDPGGVTVVDGDGHADHFDRVVVAAPWFEAARLLDGHGPWSALRDAVARIRHFDTTIAIHGDPRFMPEDRRDWSTVNAFHEADDDTWQTEWCGISHDLLAFRTWLPRDGRRPRDVWHERTYKHLVVTPENARVQHTIERLQGQHGVYLAGMYVTDVDNHESALQSAVHVAELIAPRSTRLRELQLAIAGKAAHESIEAPPPSPPPNRTNAPIAPIRDATVAATTESA